MDRWMWICAAVWALSALGAEREGALDATVSDSGGKSVQLRTYWGKPTVLFYEDRRSVKLNQALKDELFEVGRTRGMLKAASVVAVANLQGYNWLPARQFALAGVREAEVEAGVPVLVDWTGALSSAPWNLPNKTSSVLVLDSAGQVVFERSGALSAAERAEVFAKLEQLLNRGTP